jgi:hypothetical protein
MRSALGQVQERAPVRPTPEPTMPNGGVPTVKEIPYDYVATFTLQGRRGNRVQDVINISVDGAFVAVAIGYSFIPDLAKHVTINELAAQRRLVWNLNGSGELQDAPDNLESIDVDFLSAKVSTPPLPLPQLEDRLVDPVALLQCLLVHKCGIDFKYSIIDSGTGRELQNQPIHNIAGLGEPSGERPFRPFAKPILFMPRSTIRIEVEELSVGRLYKDAQLYIVLHGYKILGYGTGLP